LGRPEKSLIYAGKRIAYIEKHPERMKDEVISYIQSINNLIIACEHITNRHAEIERAIIKLQVLKEKFTFRKMPA